MKRKITLSQVEYYKGSYSQCDATLLNCRQFCSPEDTGQCMGTFLIVMTGERGQLLASSG